MQNRDYPSRPFVGVGVVIWRGPEVLLVRRAKAPRLDEWSIPGGAQKLGETVRQTAVRETREETGLSIEVLGLIDVVDAIFTDDADAVRHHYALVDFSARWISGDATPGDDVSDTAWIKLERLDEFDLWEETERIIRQSAANCGADGAPT